jgi:antitoxin ParD1/3/4
MATMKVSLPDAMLAWVEGQTRSGRYPNAGEYVCDLIRRDQERADKIAHLQRLVDEGLGSGVGERSVQEVRVEARRWAGGCEWSALSP